MTSRILFWQTSDWFNYNLAFVLQQKNLELYALIDVPNKPKKFFQEQNFVKYKKIWFFHDHIKNEKKYDLAYLEKIEAKYGINLWMLAYNERIFYNYNQYRKFQTNEVLSIIEQECRLFENIIEEIVPDFLIISITWQHQGELLRLLCKAKGIKVLMINPFIFGGGSGRWMISEDFGSRDYPIKISTTSKDITFERLEKIIEEFGIKKNIQKLTNGNPQNSKLLKFQSGMKVIFGDNSNTKTHFTYYGRSRFKIIKNELVYLIKTRIRESFINRNFPREISDSTKFVFFPLHTEEERATLIGAPLYTNQVEIIKNIIKSLPVGYDLVIKEHPAMKLRGWRKISEYKDMMNLPNVKLVHPSLSTNEIIKKSSLVITISSTTGFEAAFYQKSSISFMPKDFSNLSFSFVVNNMNELPGIIRRALKAVPDPNELFNYLSSFKNELFNFNYIQFQLDYGNMFYHGGNLVDVDIDEKSVKVFLDKEKDIFSDVANKYLDKIHEHLTQNSKIQN